MSISKAALAVVCLLMAAGCVTEREVAQETDRERNPVFEAWKKVPEMKLAESEKDWFRRLEWTDGQSLHLMMLAKDAMLQKRYHEQHDLTIVCIQGSAIVEVEGKRYFIQSPASVFVPRLRAYSVIPHKTEAPFTALMVYSPAFDGTDVVLPAK